MILVHKRRNLLTVGLMLLAVLIALVAAVPAQAQGLSNFSAFFVCPDTVVFSFDYVNTPIGSPPLEVAVWQVTAVNGNTGGSASASGAIPFGSGQINGSLTLPASTGDVITVTLGFGQPISTVIIVASCNVQTVGFCPLKYPILGHAIVSERQPTFARSGDQAKLLDGTPIYVPVDADGNGWDDYLIVDTLRADFNGDGIDEFYLGLYLGTSCDLVYVPWNQVTISQSSDALDLFLAEAAAGGE